MDRLTSGSEAGPRSFAPLWGARAGRSHLVEHAFLQLRISCNWRVERLLLPARACRAHEGKRQMRMAGPRVDQQTRSRKTAKDRR